MAGGDPVARRRSVPGLDAVPGVRARAPFGGRAGRRPGGVSGRHQQRAVVVRGRWRILRLMELWADRAFLRDVQYRTDANLAARQSIYAYQQPQIDLQARVLDLAAPAPGATVADVGCGNGAYLAELARRGFGGRVLGLDLSLGMLAAARDRSP